MISECGPIIFKGRLSWAHMIPDYEPTLVEHDFEPHDFNVLETAGLPKDLARAGKYLSNTAQKAGNSVKKGVGSIAKKGQDMAKSAGNYVKESGQEFRDGAKAVGEAANNKRKQMQNSLADKMEKTGKGLRTGSELPSYHVMEKSCESSE